MCVFFSIFSDAVLLDSLCSGDSVCFCELKLMHLTFLVVS